MRDIDRSSDSERADREKSKSEIDSKRYVIGLRTAGNDSERERERESIPSKAIHHSSTTWSWESSWADCLVTAPYTKELVTENRVLGRIRVCRFRTGFFEKRQFFFGSSFPSKLRVLVSLFEEHSPFVLIKPHIHILRVYSHKTLTAIPPSSLHCTCFVYTVTDVPGDPPAKFPLRADENLQPVKKTTSENLWPWIHSN